MVDKTFIAKWLQKPDYQSGVEFYLLHGTNQALKSLLQKGPTAFTKKKLQEEIAKLANLPVEKPKPMPAQEFVPVPDWALEKAQERIGWIKEQQFLRSQLVHYKTDEERRVAAFRILELMDLIYETKVDLDEFKKSGKVPTKIVVSKIPDFSGWNEMRLQKHLVNSLRTRKSRYRNEPEKLVAILEEEAALKAEILKRSV